ncbi:MAG: glycosyl hydrolase family 8 [Patescibacteria group bacterium]
MFRIPSPPPRLWQKFDWLLLGVLLIALVSHGVNLFGFPSYREDEGTYMSQAWSVIHQGTLAPYTYWYDHSPAGWFLLALWELGPGNLIPTSLTVDSGRLCMLVLHLVSTFLLYQITQKITGRKAAAVIAALLFSLVPLAIIFHRRVLLDNIMVFWFLLSLWFLTRSAHLSSIMMSALTFAIAVLTKESAIAFLPIMVLIVATSAHKNHRHFAVIGWVGATSLTISLYIIFALLSGELFPSGTIFGGGTPHVSLIEALRFHINREGGWFLSPGSSFRVVFDEVWWRYGAVFLVLGSVATLINLLTIRKRLSFLMSALSISYVLFIIRGQVLDWYIIPLIPLFSISVAALFARAFQYFQKPTLLYRLGTVTAVFIGIALISELWTRRYIFTLPQTANERLAVTWVKKQLPTNRQLLIDNYAFVDLNPGLSDITKARAHYYWKVDTDPMIKDQVFKNNWQSIDYLLFTPALTRYIYGNNLALVKEAYEKSHVIKRFNNHNILNEGYPVEIREVHNDRSSLKTSWSWYKEHYITSEGRVFDHSLPNGTTSEGQSYAMLRSVWDGDQETFDRVWQWTNHNLKLPESNLFAWLYNADYTTAADADLDIALSLLFAYKKWHHPEYLSSANMIMNDIWTHEVVPVNGRYYLASSANSLRSSGYLLNPSYFSPATYRIFAQVDPAHDWQKLATHTYETIAALPRLPPNWVIVKPDGTFDSSIPYTSTEADYHGYDAFRLYWRVALDATWFKTDEAIKYLGDIAPFFAKEWQTHRRIRAIYTTGGSAVVPYDDLSTYTGALSVFFVTHPELAIDLYSEKFWPEFKDGHWGEPTKYYNQNWGWFATALYANNTPNLWSEDTLAKEYHR